MGKIRQRSEGVSKEQSDIHTTVGSPMGLEKEDEGRGKVQDKEDNIKNYLASRGSKRQ